MKYRQAFEDYVTRHNYKDVKALVAFSGKVKIENTEYTEPSMNGFAEDMLQIKDLLLHSEKLKTSAKNNTEQDFEFSFYDNTDDALIEGLSQNQDFFSLLLSNDDIKHRVLGVFLHEVYKELREQQ